MRVMLSVRAGPRGRPGSCCKVPMMSGTTNLPTSGAGLSGMPRHDACQCRPCMLSDASVSWPPERHHT